MISSLIKKDARLKYFYSNIHSLLTNKQKNLQKKIDKFLNIYCKYHKLDQKEILNLYFKFLKSYSKDCENFVKTKKYPYKLNNRLRKIERISYDLALIISCLVTSHRFKIMEQISMSIHVEMKWTGQ